MVKMRENKFFLPGGGQVPGEFVAGIEDNLRSDYRSREIPSSDLNSVLERVDFEWINHYLVDLAKRSGVEPSDVIVNREYFFNSRGLKNLERRALGGYHSASASVFVDADQVVVQAKHLGVDTNLAFFDVICHESVHAASRQEIINRLPQPEYSKICTLIERFLVQAPFLGKKINLFPRSAVSGYEVTSHYELAGGLGIKQVFWERFDEAVTEKMSRQLFLDYFKHNPQLAGSKEVEFFISNSWRETDGYSSSLRLLEILISQISREAGVTTDTLWQGLINGKLRGEKLLDGELNQLLDKFFPPEFWDRLATAKNEQDMANLAKDFLTG